MANDTNGIEERMYELAKGCASFGGINLSWDLTGGLTKEQWLLRNYKQQPGSHGVQKNGRVVIPSLGIN